MIIDTIELRKQIDEYETQLLKRISNGNGISLSVLQISESRAVTIKLAALPKERGQIDLCDLVEFYRSIGFSEDGEQYSAAVIMSL